MAPLIINNLVTQSDTQNVVLHEKEVLLKSLIRQVTTSNPTSLLQGTEQTVNEVIFESDIDGVHYYLVRCPSRTNSQINLSPRERAIAKLVAHGLPNKSISNLLHISPWTVATHLRRIFGKLGVTSRTAMITRLLEDNLLQE